MASLKETIARAKQNYTINQQEWIGIIAISLAIGFIFSFRNWGIKEFNILIGVKNFIATLVAAFITVFTRISFQKIHGFTLGLKPELRVWWAGLIASLLLCFVSDGYLTLIFVGTLGLAFMVRHRLGLFRGGFNFEEQGIVVFWGLIINIAFAVLFKVGYHFYPTVIFFKNGFLINLIWLICSIMPFPKNDGLLIYNGSRGMYYVVLVAVLITTLLLYFGGGIGLLIAIILGIISAFLAFMVSSET